MLEINPLCTTLKINLSTACVHMVNTHKNTSRNSFYAFIQQ